ncbi:oligosaccharide flippase family protein [Candidatus Uhrbacteria bacterium]|nr:oligosaccharide flippase family protein [Candidatus Uhrbacteria bacterium]MBD3284284.1 oligosaccharide flippase family protein [Candidatus Uhrbacteria bacterium]
MSLARALAANTAVQVAGKVVSTILGVIVVGLMTRLLGKEGFGAYSTANAFLQVFAIVLDMGLNVMVVQMLGERRGDKPFEDRAVSAVFSLRCFSALIILSLAPVIGLLTPYSWELKMALFAIWGSFFFTALNQIVIGVQQRHLKMHVVAIAEVTGRVVLLLGVLLAMSLNWGLIPVVLIVSLAGTANFLVNFLIARRYAKFTLGFDWSFWKLTIQRAWPIGVSILFTLIYFKSDTLILSWVRPLSEVGIYGAAYRVLEILATFPFMYAGVLLPIIANAWSKGDHERFSKLIRRSFDAFALLTMPMIFGTLLVADQAMVLVAGPEFLASGDVLRILMIATGSIYLGTIFSHAVVALDKQKAMLPYYIAVALVTLILYILFIPTYGIWAAAWLTVFSEVTIAIITLIMTVVAGKMKLNWMTTGKALIASLIMIAIARPFLNQSLALTMIIAIAVYTILIIVMKAVTKEMLLELLRTRKGAPTADDTIG